MFTAIVLESRAEVFSQTTGGTQDVVSSNWFGRPTFEWTRRFLAEPCLLELPDEAAG
jgi:hypothetical protein